jgi:hypothetical protein
MGYMEIEGRDMQKWIEDQLPARDGGNDRTMLRLL